MMTGPIHLKPKGLKAFQRFQVQMRKEGEFAIAPEPITKSARHDTTGDLLA
jgi:hypothetical protein